MKKFLGLILVIVMVFGVGTAALADKFMVTTTEDPLNVRDAPGGGAIIGQLKKGTVFEGTQHDKYWVKLTYNGTTAYVYRGYATPVINGQVAEDPVYALVNVHQGSTLNVREKATVDSTILFKLSCATEVRVIRTVGSWSYIQYKNMNGWVYNAYLLPASHY